MDEEKELQVKLPKKGRIGSRKPGRPTKYPVGDLQRVGSWFEVKEATLAVELSVKCVVRQFIRKNYPNGGCGFQVLRDGDRIKVTRIE